MATPETVDARGFYAEYFGHPIDDLKVILPKLKESSSSLIWLAGDSSLDNKYWFTDRAPAEGAYKDILRPAQSKCDVAYWLNQRCQQQGRDMAAINTSVEASTLNERTFKLRPQDKFLRENIAQEDTLVVSVGGNDVALCPCPCTIASILCLIALPASCVNNGVAFGTVPVDDCCCGCGASLASCACACPPCLGYLSHLFGTRVEKYIRSLTRKQRPKKILVCMIYFLDESTTPSWAGGALAALGYNSDPSKLQALIRKFFAVATSNINIPGSEVIPVALFEVLDGKNPDDYIARVEPSPRGGEKMADYILKRMDEGTGVAPSASPGEVASLIIPGSPSAPTTSYMGDRM